MSFGDYAEGAAFFALMLGGVLGGAWLLLARRLAHLTGAPRLVAYATVCTLGVLTVHLAPAVLGVLGRPAVLLATALWVGGALRVPATTAPSQALPESATPSDAWSPTVAAVATGGLVLMASLVVASRLTVPTYAVDALNFHLPGVAAWIQSGSIWQIDVYNPDISPGHYPQNGDVMVLAAVLPWKNDFLAHLAMYPFLALVGAAVYAASLELRASRAASVLAGCLVVAVPSVSLPALEGGLTDPVMLAGFASGLLFLLRHHRTGATSDLVLAGLALGVSAGTKWYGVSSVAVVLALWAAASWRARRHVRPVLRDGAALVGLAALTGGIWLLRNLVQSGNPVFPVKVAPFGLTLFDAPRDVVREIGGFSIADYLDDPGIWRDWILPQYKTALAAPTALMAAGVVVALLLLGLARRGRHVPPRGGPALAAALCALLLAVVYSMLPYTAGGPENIPFLVAADARYLTPALVVAAPVLAWAAGSLRPGRLALAVWLTCLLAVADGVRRIEGEIEPRIAWPDVLEVVAVTLVLAVIASVVVALRENLGGRTRRVALAGVGVIVALVLVTAGHDVQQSYNRQRYLGMDAAVDYLLGPAGSGHTVGLAGTWPDDGVPPPLPAYGPRYGNRVVYVGRSDQDVLRQYRSQAAFARALGREKPDYLVVGRGRPPVARVDEEGWAEAAGFRAVAHSDRLTLLRSPVRER